MASKDKLTEQGTTRKQKRFQKESPGLKKVDRLAGIGPVLGGRLASKGFDRAAQVLVQLLFFGKDKNLFKDWLKTQCRANIRQVNLCYRCLMLWIDKFLINEQNT